MWAAQLADEAANRFAHRGADAVELKTLSLARMEQSRRRFLSAAVAVIAAGEIQIRSDQISPTDWRHDVRSD